MEKLVRFRSLALGLVVSCLMAASAHSADIDFDKVPEVDIQSEKTGLYVKAFMGAAFADFSGLDHLGSGNAYHWTKGVDLDDAAFLIGGGLGYRLNDILRLDTTVEYRAKNRLNAEDQWNGNARRYSGDVTSTVLMVNAYADLLTVKNITPYLGAGLGASGNHISDMRIKTATGDFLAGSKTNWDLAWALHAGFGVKLNKNLMLDVGYSYSDLGDAKTSGFNGLKGLTADHLTSHDVKVGLRYSFN